MRIREAAKRLFGREPEKPEVDAMYELEQNIIKETASMISEPRTCKPASYTNMMAPMTYEELQLIVPIQITDPKDKCHNAVYGLLQSMARSLEDARRVSKQIIDFDGRLKNVPLEYKIRAIQEQMSACRFRLTVHDTENVAEAACLRIRLQSLYEQAKVIDPDGTARYERYVDKQLRKRGRA